MPLPAEESEQAHGDTAEQGVAVVLQPGANAFAALMLIHQFDRHYVFRAGIQAPEAGAGLEGASSAGIGRRQGAVRAESKAGDIGTLEGGDID